MRAVPAAVSVVRLIFSCSVLPAEQPVVVMLLLVVSHCALAVAFRVMVANESAALNAVSSVTVPPLEVQAVAI